MLISKIAGFIMIVVFVFYQVIVTVQMDRKQTSKIKLNSLISLIIPILFIFILVNINAVFFSEGNHSLSRSQDYIITGYLTIAFLLTLYQSFSLKIIKSNSLDKVFVTSFFISFYARLFFAPMLIMFLQLF